MAASRALLGSMASGLARTKARSVAESIASSVAKLATTARHVQNIVLHFTIETNLICGLFPCGCYGENDVFWHLFLCHIKFAKLSKIEVPASGDVPSGMKAA
jgi:hypothetical protein